jgi:peptide/nickel transport system permease protein
MGVKDLLRRAARSRLAVIGGTVVATLALMGLLADYVAPHNPYQQNLSHRLAPPTAEYLLGTDWAGRDTLSRLIHGTRITFAISLSMVTLAGVVGVFLGIVGGYYGGIVDSLVVAVADVFFAFPSLVLALAIASLLGVSTRNLVFALAVIYTPIVTRITRGAVLATKNQDYVEAAIALGSSTPHILWRHILPNIVAPVTVQLTIGFSWTILAEAGLTYLGFGAQPPDASWGMVLNEGRSNVLISPWPSLFAGMFIGVAALGFNFLGDGLRDVLDPSLRHV